jgi:hypothetical protein
MKPTAADTERMPVNAGEDPPARPSGTVRRPPPRQIPDREESAPRRSLERWDQRQTVRRRLEVLELPAPFDQDPQGGDSLTLGVLR